MAQLLGQHGAFLIRGPGARNNQTFPIYWEGKEITSDSAVITWRLSHLAATDDAAAGVVEAAVGLRARGLLVRPDHQVPLPVEVDVLGQALAVPTCSSGRRWEMHAAR